MEQLLTVNEVAEAARVSKMTIYRLIHEGTLSAVRVGRSFRVPLTATLQLLGNPAPAPIAPRPAPGFRG